MSGRGPGGRSGIICAGSWCVDVNNIIDRWPDEETVAKILSASRQGGCPGHNMTTALRRLGATFPVEGVGLIGDDEEGRLLASICDELRIDRRRLVMRSDLRTSVTYAMIAKRTGKRTFFYSAGAHAVQTPDMIDFADSGARIAHVGLPGIHDIIDAPWRGDANGWVTILKKARAAGLRTNIELVSVDPPRIRELTEPMLPHLSMMIVNDLEAGAVAGLTTVRDGVTDIPACRQAAAALLARSEMELVAVHFPRGGIVATRDGTLLERPSVNVPPAEVKSSNGAGDCFAAGILFGVHEGWPFDRALQLAHAAAAASLRAESTTGAVVPWQECLALADRWGWREGWT